MGIELLTGRRHKEFQMQGAHALMRGGVLGSTSEWPPAKKSLAARGYPARTSGSEQMGCLCRRPLGFTLLEVLVSLSIVAIAVTVVLQLFSADLRAIAASDDYASAVIKAEAKMREVLDKEDLTETSWSEATPDGYRMDVSITDVLKEKTNNLQVRLLDVSLTTRWFKGTKEKMLNLRTMKVVNKLAPAIGGAGVAGAVTPSTAAQTAGAPGAARPGVRGQ